MDAMESLMKLFYEWEVQLLVLLSFTLQMFLFFIASLRRRSTNMYLRLSIWIAYLGADFVAVYVLGYLSRHADSTNERHILRPIQSLAFFWSPFLLVHLGGQDTITAFAMEDNNLWLRHLLNLVVQVLLALYVFSKSIGRYSVELLVSSIFVFVAGIIKYGERTWSLKCGSLASLESSTGHHYKQRLPEVTEGDAGYSNIVSAALNSMQNVFNFFAARNLFADEPSSRQLHVVQDPNKLLQVVELELAMMYDDLYTKALVLRTRRGIVLRCISHISAVVAFAFFLASDKGTYRIADTAITYVLFIGGFFLEMCAVLIFMMSPWTWAELKARKREKLASLSWFLFSSDIGWSEKKARWSHLMGQHNYHSWFTGDKHPRSFNKRVLTVAIRLVNLVGAEKESIFWMSKLLHTEYVEVDKMTMERVVKGVKQLSDEFPQGPRQWPLLGDVLKTARKGTLEQMRAAFIGDFGVSIVWLHMLTEEHLSKYRPSDMDAMVKVCRKLSNYMMYLLVTQPSMLPLNASATATLQGWQGDDILASTACPEPAKETLEEMVDIWTRLLLYAASKSRAEMHSAQLSRGGELITFAWLLLAHNGLGDSDIRRIRLCNINSKFSEVCAFYFVEPRSSPQENLPSVEAI